MESSATSWTTMFLAERYCNSDVISGRYELLSILSTTHSSSSPSATLQWIPVQIARVTSSGCHSNKPYMN